MGLTLHGQLICRAVRDAIVLLPGRRVILELGHQIQIQVPPLVGPPSQQPPDF